MHARITRMHRASKGHSDPESLPETHRPAAPSIVRAQGDALQGGRINRLASLTLVSASLFVAGCTDELTRPLAPTASAVAPRADITPATPIAFRQVSAGWEHTCGVSTSNVAYCWGDNSEGRLGSGTKTGPEQCDVIEAGRKAGSVPCSRQQAAGAGAGAGWAGLPIRERRHHPHLRRNRRERGVLLGGQPQWPARDRHQHGAGELSQRPADFLGVQHAPGASGAWPDLPRRERGL
jgi:hypothetical protein